MDKNNSNKFRIEVSKGYQQIEKFKFECLIEVLNEIKEELSKKEVQELKKMINY